MHRLRKQNSPMQRTQKVTLWIKHLFVTSVYYIKKKNIYVPTTNEYSVCTCMQIITHKKNVQSCIIIQV